MRLNFHKCCVIPVEDNGCPCPAAGTVHLPGWYVSVYPIRRPLLFVGGPQTTVRKSKPCSMTFREDGGPGTENKTIATVRVCCRRHHSKDVYIMYKLTRELLETLKTGTIHRKFYIIHQEIKPSIEQKIISLI